MHEVVAGSGEDTIDLALLSTGINEEYIKDSARLKRSSTKSVEHYLRLMENHAAYATYTEIAAANQLSIVLPRATDTGWSTLSITIKCEHLFVTYYCSIATSTITCTVHSIH